MSTVVFSNSITSSGLTVYHNSSSPMSICRR